MNGPANDNMEQPRPSSDETAPLLAPAPPPRTRRTVTFHDNPVTITIEPEDYPRQNLNVRSYGTSSSSSHMMTSAPLGGISSGSIGSVTSKLKRRNSAGTGAPVASTSSLSTAVAHPGQPKIGPQRSTKTAQKLKELPLPDFGDEGPDEESGREVYSQFTRIKDPKARRDAARLGKADRAWLPRVTAYCTANKYQLESLKKWLKASAKKRGCNPKRIDECLYTPFSYTWRRDGSGNQTPLGSGSQTPVDEDISTPLTPSTPGTPFEPPMRAENSMFPPMRQEDSGVDMVATEDGNLRNNIEVAMADRNNREMYPDQNAAITATPTYQSSGRTGSSSLKNEPTEMPLSREDVVDGNHITPPPLAGIEDVDFDTSVEIPEIFLFDYGVVVIWGMTEVQEAKLLKDIRKWSPVETLEPEQVEAEYFSFYYTREYQARIYNDFIALRHADKRNYMTKLAISHGLAQSVKTNLYEELIAGELEGSKDLPVHMALAGKMALSKTEINMKIGKLFILRIQVHLNGSVLDTPELFWTEPQLEPVYQATRKYLEMDQRIEVLGNRLTVIGDLLTVLKDQLSHGHDEMLEWIGEFLTLFCRQLSHCITNCILLMYNIHFPHSIFHAH